MGRFIGVRPRRKKTVEGEARPTQVAIIEKGKVKAYDLPNDQAELDFVFVKFPIRYRDVRPEDKMADFLRHQLKWRELEKGEDASTFPPDRVERLGKKKVFVVIKAPDEFEGPRAGDTIALPLGGSGDMFAYALARRAAEIKAAVLRTPFYRLKEARDEGSKDEDATLIAQLAQTRPEIFYPVRPRDLGIILMRELCRGRIMAMQARIACEQRLHEVLVGKVFTGTTPEAEIEKRFEAEKANDQILNNLVALEDEAEAKLVQAVEALEVYQRVFAPIEGVGPLTAARIIAGVVDIRRFKRDQFVSFCDVCPDDDGKFRRRRRGQAARGNPFVRQGFWLIIADQANRRPGSVWGDKLREVKAKQREKHPEVVIVNGKKRFTPGHIQRRAGWPTMVQLARWIYSQWSALERESESKE